MNLQSYLVLAAVLSLAVAAVWQMLRCRGCDSCGACDSGGNCVSCGRCGKKED